MLKPLKEGGTFVLNSKWNTLEEVEQNLPNNFKKQLAEKGIQFYNIDAAAIAN